MNTEYKERINRADDAAQEFFANAVNKGDMEMLQNDEEIRELYLKAYDVVGAASEEEKDFYLNFTDYYLYKCVLLIQSGKFAKLVGNNKSFTSKDLEPVYNVLTGALDAAIEQNDRHKPAYELRKTQVISEFNEELSKQGIKVQKGGCYIATAVYGSYDCPQVLTLRRYRDTKLANNLFGRIFISVYYAISPALVKCFGKQKWFSHLCQGFLDKIVCKLQEGGYGNTP